MWLWRDVESGLIKKSSESVVVRSYFIQGLAGPAEEPPEDLYALKVVTFQGKEWGCSSACSKSHCEELGSGLC